ncbi:MAG: hypothetical protein CMO64_01075 [Verrucomicrobiales bacterium]|nr:hypothetical protein [Verrucomicrobiales bacterium]
MLQKRHQVANTSQSKPLHQRALRLVDEFVNVTGLKSAGHFHFHDRQRGQFTGGNFLWRYVQPPLVTRDCHARIGLVQPPSQRRFAPTG